MRCALDPDTRTYGAAYRDELDMRSCGRQLLANLGREVRIGDLGDKKVNALGSPVQERNHVTTAVDAVGVTQELGLKQQKRRVGGIDCRAELQWRRRLYLRKAVDELDLYCADAEE